MAVAKQMDSASTYGRAMDEAVEEVLSLYDGYSLRFDCRLSLGLGGDDILGYRAGRRDKWDTCFETW